MEDYILKEKNIDWKKLIAIFINLFLFISSVVITIIGAINDHGVFFRYYTTDSNVLMGLIAGLYLIFLIIEIVRKKPIPHWINIIYLLGTTVLFLTFLTVLVFLFPAAAGSGHNPWLLYAKDMFFFHFLNPILAVVSFIFMKQNKPFTLKDNFISVIPMFIYSIIYTLCVLAFKVWEDFYGFTFGGKNYLVPLVLIVMYGVIFLIGFTLIKIKNTLLKKEKNKDNKSEE